MYDDSHIIARYYHWSRAEIRALASHERRMWASKIIEHEKALAGKESNPADSA